MGPGPAGKRYGSGWRDGRRALYDSRIPHVLDQGRWVPKSMFPSIQRLARRVLQLLTEASERSGTYFIIRSEAGCRRLRRLRQEGVGGRSDLGIATRRTAILLES